MILFLLYTHNSNRNIRLKFTVFAPSTRLACTGINSFPSLPGWSLCCLCCSVDVRVSWTEGDSVRVGKPHTSLSTIPGHRQQARCGALPSAKASKAREHCSSAPLPPPVPVVVETINPTAAALPLSCGDHRSRDLGAVFCC